MSSSGSAKSPEQLVHLFFENGISLAEHLALEREVAKLREENALLKRVMNKWRVERAGQP